MFEFEIKQKIWENATFRFYETHEETVVFIDNAEGRIVIFYNGDISIHSGDRSLFKGDFERAHHISAHMARILLDGIWTSAAKDGIDANTVYEISEEVKTYTDDFNNSESAVVSAVIKHTEIECLNIWKSAFEENVINFDYPIREDRLYKLTDELNTWAHSCKSKIRFEVYYYDNGGAYAAGFKAYW